MLRKAAAQRGGGGSQPAAVAAPPPPATGNQLSDLTRADKRLHDAKLNVDALPQCAALQQLAFAIRYFLYQARPICIILYYSSTSHLDHLNRQ